MLFPFTRAWTRRQKALIVGSGVLALMLSAALVYGYKRYCRGPGPEAFYGTWKGTLDWHGSDAYFQFGADHTFSLWDRAWFAPPDSKPEFVTKGRWYAGGRFVFLRFPSTFRPDGPALQLLHIDDISPREFRFRVWRDGGVHVFQRVDSVATRASNQTMERTATRHGFAFRLSEILSFQATHALGGRRSSCSR